MADLFASIQKFCSPSSIKGTPPANADFAPPIVPLVSGKPSNHPYVPHHTTSAGTNIYDDYGADNVFHSMTSEDVKRRVAAGFSTADESAEFWKTYSKYWKGEAERLQMKVAGSARAKRGGLGKNKQTMWLTEHANLSNRGSLYNCTKASIWPHNKFLHFKGQWTVHNPTQLHPFVKHVMDHIQVPPSMNGFESDYYTEFVLPAVASKMSNLRSNFVTSCSKAFKRE